MGEVGRVSLSRKENADHNANVGQAAVVRLMALHISYPVILPFFPRNATRRASTALLSDASPRLSRASAWNPSACAMSSEIGLISGATSPMNTTDGDDNGWWLLELAANVRKCETNDPTGTVTASTPRSDTHICIS